MRHSLGSHFALGIGDPKFEKYDGPSVDDCVTKPLNIKANRMWHFDYEVLFELRHPH